MGNRIKSNKFFKYLTIGAASLGVIASATFAVTLGIDTTNEGFITDEVRDYTATFSSEGSTIMETTYKRGELIDIPANPEHSTDGEGMYFFIGWDTNGNGIPDMVPSRAYYSFNAEAVYFQIGAFDLSFLDLQNMDLESLLDLLKDLNIDWEQFMDMFNIDPETLLDWLMQNKILSFESNGSAYISYFRSTSYGDYNYQMSQFNAPSFYDSTLIRSGSVNPLSYTADKLKNASTLMGALPANFDFVKYDITFEAKQDYYPVPDCEYSGDSDADLIDSDAHYLKEPVDMKYKTEAAYVPAMRDVIDILKLVPFSNQAITKDEKDYYKYALEHYTSIPQEYESLIDAIIEKNKWVEEDYSQVDNIGAYVESLGACSMFKDGQVNLDYDKNKDPVRGLIENKQGTDLDFNTTAMMIARRLNMPARMVKGYVVPSVEKGTNDITMLNQHYWCELYVKNIGWMIFDCMNAEEFLGTNPYGELDKQSNPFEDQHQLTKIEVTKKPTKLEYYLNDVIDPAGAEVTAYYEDETSKKLNLYTGAVSVSPMVFTTEGVVTVTVSYTEDGVTKTDTFEVTVTKKPAQITSVTWDYSGAQKEYFLNEKYSSAGIKATAHYDDGTEQDVTSLIKTAGSDYMNTVGMHEIATFVQIDGKTYNSSYQIEVIRDTVITVTVSTKPTKLQYFTGETFDPTGMVVDVVRKSGEGHTYAGDELNNTNLFFLDTDFITTNEHHVVTVRYQNEDGTYAEDSFEVKVIKNNVESAELKNFKQDYTVGDSFDEGEFINEGAMQQDDRAYIEITMTSGDVIKQYVDLSDPSTSVSVPDLGTIGSTTSTVTMEVDGTMMNFNVPIDVSTVNQDKFAISSNVSTAGPGDGMEDCQNVFDYTVSQAGTYYFRNASYDTYTSGKGWSWSTTPTLKTFSPYSLTYDKAIQVYQTNSLTIHYQKEMQYGLTPTYSNGNAYDEYSRQDACTAGSSESFYATNFVLTKQTAKRLVEYVNYSDDAQSAYNSYKTVSNFNKYLNDTSDIASYNAVMNYVNNHYMYHLYDINNLEDEIDLILLVQNDISTEFVYDKYFKYPSDVDPLLSFFNEGRGICNNFATAATMVYRHLGIPARYVVGFGSSTSGGTTNVTGCSAHAWTEVFIDNLGWVIVDATGYDDGHTSGSGYGSGFGGSGFDVPRLAYGGKVYINYNYNSQFDYEAGTGYYTVFDDKDHHNIYTLSYENGGELPSYLEAEIVWNWEFNGTDLGELVTPKYDAGYYVLTPTLHIYDKSQGCLDVTAEYLYYLDPSTQNMEYTIFPCCIYIETYIMNNSAISFTGKSIDIGGGTYAIIMTPGTDVSILKNQSKIEDNPLLEMADPIPSVKTIVFELQGAFYIYAAGNYDLSFEVVPYGSPIPSDSLVVILRYQDGSYLNLDNFIIINVGGSVEVNP